MKLNITKMHGQQHIKILVEWLLISYRLYYYIFFHLTELKVTILSIWWVGEGGLQNSLELRGPHTQKTWELLLWETDFKFTLCSFKMYIPHFNTRSWPR